MKNKTIQMNSPMVKEEFDTKQIAIASKYKLDLYREVLNATNWVLLENVEPQDVQIVLELMGGNVIPQYGKDQYDIVVTSKHYSANSAESLFPHTDFNEKEDIDVLLSLYCKEADKFDEGGYTSVANMEPFIKSRPKELLDYLKTEDVCIRPNNHLKQLEYSHYFGPMLKMKDGGDFEFRFSYNFTLTRADDKVWRSFREEVLEWYNQNKVQVKIPKKGLLMVNNAKALHGRTSIYDMNRHVVRAYNGNLS